MDTKVGVEDLLAVDPVEPFDEQLDVSATFEGAQTAPARSGDGQRPRHVAERPFDQLARRGEVHPACGRRFRGRSRTPGSGGCARGPPRSAGTPAPGLSIFRAPARQPPTVPRRIAWRQRPCNGARLQYEPRATSLRSIVGVGAGTVPVALKKPGLDPHSPLTMNYHGRAPRARVNESCANDGAA